MTEWLPFHFSLSCIGEGNGNPLQCSCLENPRDGGVWWAAVSGVAQSWTRLKRLSRAECKATVYHKEPSPMLCDDGLAGGVGGREGRLKGEGIYIYSLCMQKPAQYCKEIFLQLKKKWKLYLVFHAPRKLTWQHKLILWWPWMALNEWH